MSRPGVVRLDAASAAVAVASPFAEEDLSLAGGVAALVVADPDVVAWRAWRSAAGDGPVARLPCVTVARPPALGAGDAEALGFDLVLAPDGGTWTGHDDPDGAAAGLVAAVEASPDAAWALVQLVRAGVSHDVDRGLWAESLVYGLLQTGPAFAAWRAARPAPPARAPEERPAVAVEHGDGEVVVALDRPHVRNAFDARTRDELVEVLRALGTGPPGGRVRLTGRGPAFCSGGDLSEFGTQHDAVLAHAVRAARNPARWLARLAGRVTLVADVHGACIGAGVELAAYAGEVVASEDAFFALPEVGMGLVPGAGGTVSVPRRVGRARFLWMALTGARLDARTARAWGLVDRLV